MKMCFRFFLCFAVSAALGFGQVVEKPLAEKSTGQPGGPLFEKIPAAESGVTFRYDVNPNHPLKRLYAQGWAVGNVAIGDVNGDGRNDLFFAGAGTGRNRLFVASGPMKFEDVTDEVGVAGSGWATCAVMGDVDKDGDLDIYVTRYFERNLLFVNVSENGVMRFEERAADFGVNAKGGFIGANFVDVNRDGWLDLYLSGYHVEPEKGRPATFEPEGDPPRFSGDLAHSYFPIKKDDGEVIVVETGAYDGLLINFGTGKFGDASMDSGLALARNYTVSATWADFDHDLKSDLLVGTDSHGSDLLFRHSESAFDEVGRVAIPVAPWLARGSVAADFNNDWRMDLFSLGVGPTSHREKLAWSEPSREDLARLMVAGGAMQVARNTMLANTGERRFAEVGLMAGVASSGAGWAAKAEDFDCDGWTDLFVATGEIRDRMALPTGDLEGENLRGKTRWDLLGEAGIGERREADVAWRNEGGDWNFSNVTEAWGLGGETMSYAAGAGDLDGDGDLDLVVCRANETIGIYQNHAQGNRVVFDLGKENRYHTGTEIRLETADGRQQMRQLYPSGGFRGSDPWELSIGLGKSDSIVKATVVWPSGFLTTVENLKAGKRYQLRIAPTNVKPLSRKRTVPEQRLFAETDALAGIGYVEAPFDERGALLPTRRSHEGPPLALVDLDGDGNDEVFVGGSANRAGRLLARNEALAVHEQAFPADFKSEDMAVVFFDADNDQDLDCYIGSGGHEFVSGHETYRDRLYINDGFGKFSKAVPESLPDIRHSTSAVAAADFDRDGDVDLFVGCRATVGAFPESLGGWILVNDGAGKFTNETANVAPELKLAGMVTSALWTDVNGDDALDLLVATDWGPIRIYQSDGSGKLTETTKSAGLATRLGLWRGLAGRDIDNDGDMDFVATNFGLNTAIRASAAQPKRMLWGDLAGTGKSVILETTTNVDGQLYPARSFADWTEAVPDIAKTVADARAFANGGFGQIFTPERLANARQLEINTLESGVLVNDGTGKFTFQPLPRMAQVSPGFGVVLADFDLDGLCDCVMLHNEGGADLLTLEPNDKGLGLFLRGTGEAARLFEPVLANESGFAVPGAGRSLAVGDVDGNGMPDIIGLRNSFEPALFISRPAATDQENRQPVRADLLRRGRHFAGAKATLKVRGQPDQMAEYHAGGGYFSQSAPVLFFSAPKNIDSGTLVIRWADGHVEERSLFFQ